MWLFRQVVPVLQAVLPLVENNVDVCFLSKQTVNLVLDSTSDSNPYHGVLPVISGDNQLDEPGFRLVTTSIFVNFFRVCIYNVISKAGL